MEITVTDRNLLRLRNRDPVRWSVIQTHYQNRRFYYAVKLTDDQVLRVARTTDSLLVTMLTSFLLLGGLVCVILVIELFLVQKQTRKLIEPINRINLEHPLEHVCYEELRPLLFRLDQQNRQIQKQLEDLKKSESVRKRVYSKCFS